MILTPVLPCIRSTHEPSAEWAHACVHLPTHTENGQQAIFREELLLTVLRARVDVIVVADLKGRRCENLRDEVRSSGGLLRIGPAV